MQSIAQVFYTGGLFGELIAWSGDVAIGYMYVYYLCTILCVGVCGGGCVTVWVSVWVRVCVCVNLCVCVR